MKPKFVARLFAAGMFLVSVSAVRADLPAQITPMASEALATAKIPLRNVRADIMAWWLDPKRQPEPKESVVARRAEEQWFGTSAVKSDSHVAFTFEGIEKIVPDVRKNEIEATATASALTRLRSQIEALDKPVQLIEVEARFVVVDTDDVARFGIDFSALKSPVAYPNVAFLSQTAAPGHSPFRVGRVRGNFYAALEQLTKQKRAKAIQSPRLTTMNSMTAQVGFSTGTPLESDLGIILESTIGVAVNATVRPDRTIDLFAAGPLQWKLSFMMAESAANPIQTNTTGHVINLAEAKQSVTVARPAMAPAIAAANISDGDTIVLEGLRRKESQGKRKQSFWSHVPGVGETMTPEGKWTEKDVLIFLTARIIHRADG